MIARVSLTAILLATVAIGQAQNVGWGARVALQVLRDKELLPKIWQKSPTQPNINDPTIRSGDLPKPSPDPSRQELKYEGDLVRKGPNILLTGENGVVLTYRGYEIFADRIEGNLDTNVFKATGKVKVFGELAMIKGDEVLVNMRNETFLTRDSRVDAKPELLGGQIMRNIYLKGGTTYGSKQELFGENCEITSCDKTSPHYHLQAAKVTIRPGVRAIFRKVSFKIFNRTIFKLPFLSIPLDERSYRYLPEVGNTFDEGYYAKFKFGIPLKDDFNFLDARVDYFSKKGPALGFDYNYSSPKLRGILSAYSLFGNDKTVTINSRHRQELGFGILTLDNNYQESNYLTAPGARILNTRVGLLVPQARGTNTRLDFLRNENNSGPSQFISESYKLSDARRWSQQFRTSLDLGLSKSSNKSGSNSTEREQADVRFRANYDFRRATAQLEYQRAIPVGETSSFFSGADRTPVLSLATDSRKLFGNREFLLPFTAELSVGEYANSLDKTKLGRTNLDININKPDRSGKRFRFDLNGRFKQGVYSDDTAQYTLGLGMGASYSLGRDTSVNVRYNYLRPYGFSPLQIDRLGRSNLLTADLSYRPYRTLLFAAQSGYDINQLKNELGPKVAWQSIGVRMEYRPVEYISFRALSTYDSFQRAWNNVRFDAAYKAGATFVGFGAKYDGIRKTWSTASGFIDGLKWGRLTTSFLFNYNGYLQRFESRHAQFTYDLHCAEAVVTVIDNPIGFRAGTSVNFYLRLKAFPFNTGFGTGTSGQPISISGGAVN